MRFAHFQFDPETDRLGEGPLSEVYKAIDLQLGRTVALKILRPHAEIDPQADTRFLREAKHTSSLDHPNITTIYEYGQDQGTSFIAMEFLEGQTLDKVIKEQTLGYEECLRIALQLTSALSVVHANNLIHRDLKPANVLLQHDGTVKLLDFGIARARDESGITQHGMLVGTVLYMSPEQVRGEDLGFRSDIFSLGAVLYHVMTGALPFPGNQFPEVCMAILDGRPRRPSEVRQGFPKPLEDFLLRCLQVDPADRFASAAEAHGHLVTVADKLSGTTTHRPTALRGTIVLPEIRCGGTDPKSCHVMAGGVRRDLAGELSRNKGLTVRLQGLEELDPGTTYDYVLRAELAVEAGRGTLGLHIDFYQQTPAGPKKVRTTDDACVQVDDDEWTLQEDLVRAAMRVVRRRLSEIPAQAEVGRTRRVEEAKELAARATEVMRRGTTKHLLSATSSYRRALELDPFCPQAYAGLAEALVRKSLTWDGDPTFMEEARESASRALALDSQCAAAHTALGFAQQLAGNFENAQREYRLAMQLDNGEWMAHRLLGAAYAREGNFKAASPLLQRAIALNPSHIGSYDHLYMVLQRLGRYEEALEFADAGISAARTRLAEVPDDLDALVHMAMLYARLGEEPRARRTIQRAREIAPKDAYTAFHAGCVYALLAEPMESIACLRFAQDRGYFVKSELLRNTDLDVLRGLPEFRELAS